jgi:hypothetical protein
MTTNYPQPGQVWAGKRRPENQYQITRVAGMTYRFHAHDYGLAIYRPIGQFALLIPDRGVWLCENGYPGRDFGELVFGVSTTNPADKICCPVRSWQAILSEVRQ